MYTSFFGLNEKPFAITPDPRYLFMSERHAEALAHLIYGVTESGGFIQLTGEVGTGKTTLIRSLLQQLPPAADVALVLNPQLSRTEFLSAICEELGAPIPDNRNSLKALTDSLNRYLLENHRRGRRTVLIVDEAQNLRLDVLEQVRLLTNLETAKQKLLQIILIGQPELRELLARNDMRQLAQRITGRYHLKPLSRDESVAYVDHRLKVAGGIGPIFAARAKRELFRITQGVPRMINVVADRALLGAYTQERHQVTPRLIRKAAAEVLGGKRLPAAQRVRGRLATAGLAAGALLLLAGSAWLGALAFRMGSEPAATAPVTETPAFAPAPETPAPAAPAVVEEPVPPPAPAATPLAPEPEALEPLLRRLAAETGTDTAFQTLFALWELDYRSGIPRACDQAEAVGLQCVYERGSMAQVRSLDRPVILTLRDDEGNPHQVVLARLDEDTAVIRIAEQDHTVSLRDLTDAWFGEYLLLWRPDVGKVKSFFPGMRDPDVRWLRESLAAIQGQPVEPMESDIYDASLEARVREYQRERRLVVDGLAGQQTQLAISKDLDAGDMPRLSRAN